MTPENPISNCIWKTRKSYLSKNILETSTKALYITNPVIISVIKCPKNKEG